MSLTDLTLAEARDKLAAKESVVEQLLSSEKSADAVIDEAYLATLCRYPTKREKEGFRELLVAAKGAEKRLAYEDLFWALMTSREFLFQR